MLLPDEGHQSVNLCVIEGGPEGRHAPPAVPEDSIEVHIVQLAQRRVGSEGRPDASAERSPVAASTELTVDLGPGGVRGGSPDARAEQYDGTEQSCEARTIHGRDGTHDAGLFLHRAFANTLRPVFPEINGIPAITTAQMIEVDRVMIDDLGIDLPRMMENAGRSLAALAIDAFKPTSVTVLAGSGGNGGGALVAARHLFNRGVDVSITTTRPIGEMSPVASHQLRILERMGLAQSRDPTTADVVLDGLIGYSLAGAPRGLSRELIEWTTDKTVLSLDVPSGVDSTTGETPGVSVHAAATMTLALPKVGTIAHPNAGQLYLADISVPLSVYVPFGIHLDTPFRDSPIVRVGEAAAQPDRVES